ncbi:hypothetical protein ACJIZ3_015758 [Penstemon smallii]|uniref:Uncharacterized protein n=1 Tax=Penstemon smallii TaxID=265156 RepID=A0ABD3RND3_9LAMI
MALARLIFGREENSSGTCFIETLLDLSWSRKPELPWKDDDDFNHNQAQVIKYPDESTIKDNSKYNVQVGKKEEEEEEEEAASHFLECMMLTTSERCSSLNSGGNSTRNLSLRSPLLPLSLGLGMPCPGMIFSYPGNIMSSMLRFISPPPNRGTEIVHPVRA